MACACETKRRKVLQLIDIIRHNEETYSYDFIAVDPIEWREGDSAKLFLPVGRESRSEGRKFSFATLPHEKKVRFTTRIRQPHSDFKQKLLQLKRGDFVEISQPRGHFQLKREERPALLLSNGVGIATMRGLIKAFDKNAIGIGSLTQINVDPSGRIYEAEFEELAQRNRHFHSVYTSNRYAFYDAVDEELREMMFTTERMPYFYVVGSPEFIMGVRGHLYQNGFDIADILEDKQSAPPKKKKRVMKLKGSIEGTKLQSLVI